MGENVIKTGESTIIINGGDPLPGCPSDWDEARKIEAILNEGKEENAEPMWGFDCGFKLDFDGPLARISSRFYPPKLGYGPTWDGKVSLYIGTLRFDEKQFDCKTLEELKVQVEEYKNGIIDKIKQLFTEKK